MTELKNMATEIIQIEKKKVKKKSRARMNYEKLSNNTAFV